MICAASVRTTRTGTSRQPRAFTAASRLATRAFTKPIQQQMVILGSMSLGGNIIPVESLAESLQVAFDAGAKSLDFQEQQAAADQARYEAAQRANYAQYLTHYDAAKGLGSQLGMTLPDAPSL
jgi:predicted ATP-dependent Lon-type protease